MLSKDLCLKILTIGCQYKKPRGGVAQVMNTYSKYVYSDFRCIPNSGGNNVLVKFLRAVVSYIQTLVLLIFDSRIKVLHIHTASYNSFKRSSYWVSLGRLFNKKIVLHIHGGGFKEYYKTNPQWIKSVLDKSDCLVVLSDTWKKYFDGELGCKNVEIVENIVPSPEVSKMKKEDNKLHLLFMGLITEQKGIFDLLEMINEHKELQDRIFLHVGGNGKVQEFLDMVEKFNLKSCVKFEGFVSGQKKIDLLNIADAYILPSYIEGVPISILESMSYSLPILSTPVGGIPEVVHNGVNGILFTPGNKEEIYNAINTLLNNRNTLKEMGLKSYTMITKHLPEQVESVLRQIYMGLLKDI